MTQMTNKQQIQLVQRVMRNSFYFEKGIIGATQGISKKQLAALLGVTTSAINNWLKGSNALNAKNLTFLQKLDKLSAAATNGNPLPHTVLKKKVTRRVVLHGISKYDSLKYKFLTTGQKHWTNVHAVTI